MAAIVVFSLIAWLLQKLVKNTGMTFYDRLGGALLGIGTGALVVFAILAFFYMFVPEDTNVVRAAQRSHTMRLSQRAMNMMGSLVPGEVREVFRYGAAETGSPPAGAGDAKSVPGKAEGTPSDQGK